MRKQLSSDLGHALPTTHLWKEHPLNLSHLRQDLPRNDDDLHRLKRDKSRHASHDTPTLVSCLACNQVQDEGQTSSRTRHAKNRGESDATGVVRALHTGKPLVGDVVFATHGAICKLARGTKNMSKGVRSGRPEQERRTGGDRYKYM